MFTLLPSENPSHWVLYPVAKTTQDSKISPRYTLASSALGRSQQDPHQLQVLPSFWAERSNFLNFFPVPNVFSIFLLDVFVPLEDTPTGETD